MGVSNMDALNSFFVVCVEDTCTNYDLQFLYNIVRKLGSTNL